jgi:hypothetical protein
MAPNETSTPNWPTISGDIRIVDIPGSVMKQIVISDIRFSGTMPRPHNPTVQRSAETQIKVIQWNLQSKYLNVKRMVNNRPVIKNETSSFFEGVDIGKATREALALKIDTPISAAKANEVVAYFEEALETARQEIQRVWRSLLRHKLESMKDPESAS